MTNTQPPVKSEDELRKKLETFIESWVPIHIKDATHVKEAKVSARREFVDAQLQLIALEAERHANAVIGEDDEPRNTLEHSRRNFLRAEQRNRNHCPIGGE